jgi:hypothetical protein
MILQGDFERIMLHPGKIKIKIKIFNFFFNFIIHLLTDNSFVPYRLRDF